MSRPSTERPEYRLRFDYPHLEIDRPDTPPCRVSLDTGDPIAALRGLAAEIAQARGRLTAALPEGEVWLGRMRGAGRAAARRRAAVALGIRPGAVEVALGRPAPDGTRAIAAVRRTTLAEARAFLARAGLRPRRITAHRTPGGFAAPPEFSEPRMPLRSLQAASGLAAALAFALWLAPLPPPEPAATGPAPAPVVLAVPQPAADPVPPSTQRAEIAPAPRPAVLPELARAEPPATPIPALVPIIIAARNAPGDLAGPPGVAPLAAPRAAILREAPRARPAAAAEPPAGAAETPAAQAAESSPVPLPRPDVARVRTSAAAPERAVAGPGPRPRPPQAAAAAPVDALVATLGAAIAAPAAAATPPPDILRLGAPRPRPAGAVVVASLAPQAAQMAAPSVPSGAPIAPPAPRSLPPAPRQAEPAAPRPVVAAPVPQRVVAAPAPQRVVAAPAPQRVAAVQPQRVATEREVPRGQSYGGRSSLALIGVFGNASGRHALVQLPNGETQRVRKGDQVQGVQVTAIASDAVHLRSQGRDAVIRLPE